jgi:serine/threonine protein kinase/Tfp pilus assembly protein PilF
VENPNVDDDKTRTSLDAEATISSAEIRRRVGSPATEPVPQTIGTYRVLGKLGEGGMGVVYEAEQQQPKRKVALKVVRGGQIVDEYQVKLFQREVDTLARLKHPNIAAIYESGRTEGGRHFFAMELVRGSTLDLHVANSRTDGAVTPTELRDRLRLFCRICDAVNYAHQRGVIHRDLKPSNIVVTPNGTGNESGAAGPPLPDVKILDFGLARITDSDVAATMVSEIGTIKGTLPYMSPEQVRGNPVEIDLRTDVYSLGVILYELIAGARPYEVQKGSIVEAARVICEDPPRPLRRTSSGLRRLDSDIETIVGKALEKDPDRRYASAAALSEDVQRYLQSQPILARPPSTMYQLRKLVARNRLPASFAATLVLSLFGFGIWMSVLYTRAVRAEEQATREVRTATQVSDFVSGLFQLSNPRMAKGKDVTARTILDQGAARITVELKDQPEVQARMMALIGAAYRDLGQYDAATKMLEGALARSIDKVGHDSREVADTKTELAYLLIFKGDFARAETLNREALSTFRQLLGNDHLRVAGALNNTAFGFLWSDTNYEEAERMLREALEINRRGYGTENETTAGTMYHLGWALKGQAKYEAAEQILRDTLDLRRRLFRNDHPSVAWTLNNLGDLKNRLGDYDAALPFFQEALETNRHLFGNTHPQIAYDLTGMAVSYLHLGELETAESLQWQALEMSWELLGNEHFQLARSFENLAGIMFEKGELSESGAYWSEALAINRKTLGNRHLRVANDLEGLGKVERARDNLAAASDHYVEALEIRRGASRQDNSRSGEILYELARIEALRGRGDAALDFLHQAVGGGWLDVDRMAHDPDFDSLRDEGEFQTMLALGTKAGDVR